MPTVLWADRNTRTGNGWQRTRVLDLTREFGHAAPEHSGNLRLYRTAESAIRPGAGPAAAGPDNRADCWSAGSSVIGFRRRDV